LGVCEQAVANTAAIRIKAVVFIAKLQNKKRSQKRERFNGENKKSVFADSNLKF